MKASEKSDDVVLFLAPEIVRKKRAVNRTLFLWLLISIGFALCFASFIIWFQYRNNLRLFYHISYKKRDNSPVCSGISDLEKFDCYPDAPVSENQCLKRGCCYHALRNKLVSDAYPPLNTPYCFYPENYVGYVISNVSYDGHQMEAKLKRVTPSGFPKDIQNLLLSISFIDDCTLRLKITDPLSQRFEVPIPLHFETKPLKEPCYNVHLDSEKGKLVITRKSTGAVIFSTNLSRLIYADQFLQISSSLPSPYIYGIGEHYGPLLRSVNWTRLTLFNADLAPIPNHNLYGSQPFYLALESDGKANGVFLYNSNAMDVILQPTPAITFRPIGGILDFFIMLGPTPSNVVQQYTNLVGRTHMPPYWSYGFQLCRYGYNSLNKTRETMQRTIDAHIPLDVQWNDIDYMDRYKDFTYDEVNFAGLPKFVDDLHDKGMHYVIMTDPGISNSEKPGTYAPYDDGVTDDLFIKNANGSIFIGKVWNDGHTVFPDFSHPNASSYWTKQFQSFYKEVKFDGVWIDMNEPSNFYNGGVDGCPNSTLEDPPYLPGGGDPLRTKTVCMSAKHYKTFHYNEHNLLGFREAIATNQALKTIRNKRPFIISRATFSGQGFYSGHWSGDLSSSWEDMRYTIPSMLNFNMYGISMIGSDICGFNYNTTVELCARWQALGAFYPFSRNHNEKDTIEQDPAALGQVVIDATIYSLFFRYYLLPYLNTLFYRSHVYGDTVARPIFFEYPNDAKTYNLDEQFLWGPALMIIPALYPGQESVRAYYPKGLWYDTNGNAVNTTGEYVTLPTPNTTINYAAKGGYIIPAQQPGATTTVSRKSPFTIHVILDENNEAFGELYWDDGDSLDTYENGNYNLIKFESKNNVMNSSIVKKGYNTKMDLGLVQVNNIYEIPTEVSVNGVNCPMRKMKISNINSEKNMGFLGGGKYEIPVNGRCEFFMATKEVLWILNAGTSLLDPLTVTWK